MRVLLVRLRQIGDVVFTTPIVRVIREAHPGAHLAYLVEPAAARLAVLDIVRGSGAAIRGLTAEEGRLDGLYRELVTERRQ